MGCVQIKNKHFVHTYSLYIENIWFENKERKCFRTSCNRGCFHAAACCTLETTEGHRSTTCGCRGRSDAQRPQGSAPSWELIQRCGCLTTPKTTRSKKVQVVQESQSSAIRRAIDSALCEGAMYALVMVRWSFMNYWGFPSSLFSHWPKLHGASFALLCHLVDNTWKTDWLIIMTPWLRCLKLWI